MSEKTRREGCTCEDLKYPKEIDLISRSALLRKFIFPCAEALPEDIARGLALAIELIKQAPAIEPKRGEWVRGFICYRCSLCGFETSWDFENGYFLSNYCPKCGARMATPKK